MAPVTIRLALDWTPTTLHTGFYVALANGAYKKSGIDLQITTPEANRYQTTPAQHLVRGNVELAIMPSESVVGHHANDTSSTLLAVATLLARDASALVTLKQKRLDRPQHLDGKVYASYGARFEDDIIRQIIRNDGGRGQLVSYKPERFSIWNTLLTNEADAAWIFLPWEGVDAVIRDIQLNQFLLEEYEVPYGYSPLLVSNRAWAMANADAMRRFLAITAAGYQFGVSHPEEAAQLLTKTANHPSLALPEFVELSQQAAADYYLRANQWGFMRREVWNAFVNWLLRHDLVIDRQGDKVQHMDIDALFTNQFLS